MESNLVYIGILIIIIAAVIIYTVKRGRKSMYYAALYFVTVAEETFGSRTGKIKFAQVVTEIKKRFPALSLFIRQKVLEEIIEDALLEMKTILEEKLKEEENEDEDSEEEKHTVEILT